MVAKAKEVAIKKRAQIDKATQIMLIAVGGASVVLGCAIVLSIYFVRYMGFNAKVIGESGKVIDEIKVVQKNVKELETAVGKLSENESLEVVSRVREARCADYLTTKNDANMSETQRATYVGNNIGTERVCSALRVIPDALPSIPEDGDPNEIAVYASLNKLFLATLGADGLPVQPIMIQPGTGDTRNIEVPEGVQITPVALVIEDTVSTANAVLDTIERSIRNYDIQTVMIAWRSSGEGQSTQDLIELRGNAVAYHSAAVTAGKKTKTVYADESKAKSKSKTGAKK